LVLITPRRNSLVHAVTLGTFQAPAITQNSLVQVTASFTLPSQPRFFPGGGHKFYVRLVANSDQQVLEANTTNNLSKPIPVSVAGQALPALRATALYVPPVMQPGDTIAPTILVANLGTAATTGTVQVALVASTTKNFTVGSSIIALYNITASIPSASQTTTGGSLASLNQNLTPPSNVVTITGAAVTLPTSPSKYFLGVVVDPFDKINELSRPANALSLIQVVGPPIPTLPPAGVVSAANTNPFPEPPSGHLIGVLTTTTSSSGQTVNS
jgi:hypothetical protein